MKSTEQQALRLLVRSRDDFQQMRKRMDNRIGRKADKSEQNIDERAFTVQHKDNFAHISDAAKLQEKDVEKMFKKSLKSFPIFTEWLTDIHGVAETSAAFLISEFDIEKATTVSKMWQYAGLNPDEVKGKKSVKKANYKKKMGPIIQEITDPKGEVRYIVETNELIRGDKPKDDFILPYNKTLKANLLGKLATNFLRSKSPYALTYYYPYKKRLSKSKKIIKGKNIMWKKTTDGHRERAARRYMIKMFLIDFYVAWRTLEKLPVRPPYQEEYLGHKHKETH